MRYTYTGTCPCNWRDERMLMAGDVVEIRHDELGLRMTLEARADFTREDNGDGDPPPTSRR